MGKMFGVMVIFRFLLGSFPFCFVVLMELFFILGSFLGSLEKTCEPTLKLTLTPKRVFPL